MDNQINLPFGQRLKHHRQRSADSRGNRLSQLRLAGLLADANLPYNRNHVGQWEAGQPIIAANDRRLLILLIKIFYTHGGLTSPAEAAELLALGNFRGLDPQELEQIEPGWVAPPLEPPPIPARPSALPQRSHQPFIGRRKELEACLALLRDPGGPRLLAITGFGGVGKSALARALVEVLRQESGFTACWWTTAKQQSLDPLEELSPEPRVTAEVLLERLQGWLGLNSQVTQHTRPERRDQLLRQALEPAPVLLVLDNLETTEDPDLIAERFARLLAGSASRAVLTSREEWSASLAPMAQYPLKGLDELDALQLLRALAPAHRPRRTEDASESALRDVARAVGYLPLALKLAAGLLESFGVSDLLETLKHVQAGEVRRLYDFLFAANWRTLAEAEKDVLIAIASFDEQDGIRSDDLRRAGVVAAAELPAALEQLKRHSLIEVVGSLEDTRYLLHPLTVNFLRAQRQP